VLDIGEQGVRENINVIEKIGSSENHGMVGLMGMLPKKTPASSLSGSLVFKYSDHSLTVTIA
jgi:hypothetical protein